MRIKEVRKEGRKGNWIREISRKNCLTKHVTEGVERKYRSDGKTSRKA